MGILSLLIVLVMTVAPFAATASNATITSDEAAARVPLENYIKGQETGDGSYIRKAFLAEARIMAFRDGKLLNLSVEEFASRFSGKPAADEAQRKRRIESVEITGTAGVGKIVLNYPTVTFTDYMSLIKVDGEWKISNKTFHAEPVTTSTAK
jgi:regulator of protease activity HflC (stomatin/prohibitin superfamily)